MTIRWLAAALLIVMPTLSGCVAAVPPPSPAPEQMAAVVATPEPQPAPIKPFKPIVNQTQARAALVAGRSRAWKDPGSVREAKIGDPYECLLKDGTTCFCIEANARNSYGGFTGLALSQARFRGPRDFEMIDAMYAPEHCGRMVAFPEMNGH